MLRTRIITALLLLPLVLAPFIYGEVITVLPLLFIIMSVCVYEASMMLFPAFEEKLAKGLPLEGWRDKFFHDRKFALPAVACLFGGLILLSTALDTFKSGRGIIVLGLMACFLIGAFSARHVERAAARTFALLLALIYGVLPWLAVWDLFLMGPNSRYILLLMAVAWLGDTGGYFGGRTFGGKIFGQRKLAPVLSPNKTWEGAISGLITSIIGALVMNAIFGGQLGPWWVLALAGAAGGVFGQMGDLVESMLKRFSGVKDSSGLIPGHGGMLDRIDAILFAAPVIWFILYFFR